MNKHPQLLDLLNGYYKCRQCNKIAPIQTMAKHVNICDWDDQPDISPYDIEVQKMYDLMELRDYYSIKPKKLESQHIKANNVHIMAQFPSMMVKRLEEKIFEQRVICWQMDKELHTHPSQMEVEEIRTIRDVVKLKRLESLEELY